jgi:mono/diheme cytochrome c family protein
MSYWESIMSDCRYASIATAAAILLVAATSTNAQVHGDSATGKAVAERWCSSCHLVSMEQSAASADVPSFQSIAERYGSDISALEGFLADPHPPMPQLSLTRDEIRDLLAYIASLSE